MGRSRAVSLVDNDDSNQSKSKKRKRIAASNLDPTSTSTTTGQGTSDVKGGIGGGGALYHCNYCNKDISGKIRIKCAVCSDFDLCVECFSVGAEITPHKTNHSYRVMDNLSFPLLCPDWNADEEILLLEAIEMYGFGNWSEVAEHVGTKRKSQCVDHYNTVYVNSSCFPLPDLSLVMGKSREELLAMAEQQNNQDMKEFQAPEQLMLKEESPVSAGVKVEEARKEDPVPGSSPSLTSGSSTTTNGVGSSNDTSIAGLKKASTVTQMKDGFVNVKVEESQSDRSVGEKKPRISGNEGPSIMELSGFNFKRQEFENEYDNDAEQLLSDMEFKKTDTVAEHELKLRVLRIYNKRLEERKRRKEFIIERNLLYPDPFQKNLSPEEREICQKYKVFMRFHTKEEHEELLKTVIEEHRILKKIQDLQEARAAGCRTSADAERYVEQKRKKEAAADEIARRAKEGGLASPRGGMRGPPPMVLESSGGNDLLSSSMKAGQDLTRNIDIWDVNGFVGADLLSEVEKQLCNEMRILPSHYLNMLQNISVEIMKGNITQKSDAHSLFKEKVESSKVDKVYDMLVMKRIAPQC